MRPRLIGLIATLSASALVAPAIEAKAPARLDKAVGRVVSELKTGGEFDDTLIVFLSDNGAEARDPAPRPGTPPVAIEAMGTAQSYVNYGSGWANAATTPF